MLKKRLYTFIVPSHAGGKVWRLSIPYSLLAISGIFALVGVMVIGGAAFQYGKMLLKVIDYNDRLSENDALRSENHEYKVQTAQLGEKVDFLETLSHRLMVFSGMSSDKAVGGVGGSAKDVLTRPRSTSAGTLQSIASYDQKVSSLEERLRYINNLITDEVLVEAAAPSIQPVKGYITQGWGLRDDPFNPSVKESHPGVDISAPMGSKVVASADGTVIFAGQRAGYGNIIVIDHKFGMTTRYAHLQRMVVDVGQHVSRTDVIGFVGMSGRTTGPHLHYEVWQNNRCLDPTKYFQAPRKSRTGKP
jgi:murein DD-endopeptidase MepM/ murein hydrolase activator NlpD